MGGGLDSRVSDLRCCSTIKKGSIDVDEMTRVSMNVCRKGFLGEIQPVLNRGVLYTERRYRRSLRLFLSISSNVILLFGVFGQVLDDAEPPRRRSLRDHDVSEEGDPRTAYLQPSLKAEPFARPELERDHQANIDFERYRGRV